MTPIRIERSWSLAALIFADMAAEPMLPGLIRRHAASPPIARL
jgi:hypothetical protein